MKELIVSVIFLTGALFMFIASLGLLRFKDLYSRMHAVTKAPSFGILLLLIGDNLYFQSGYVLVKSLLIILFIYITSPLAALAISKACNDQELSKD